MTREAFEASLRGKLEVFRGEAGLSSGRLETYVRELMPLYDEMKASNAPGPHTEICLECGQRVQVQADGRLVTHEFALFPAECDGSGKGAYA
jgi:hypothetical protein